MLDMHALDTLIAVVVVIFVLSLIVQSVQAAIKKLMRIKSKQIEDSLVDLFEQVLDKQSATTPGSTPAASGSTPSPKPKSMMSTWRENSPFIRSVTPGEKSPPISSEEVRKLYEATMTRFGELGRVAQNGTKALESLTKEDLSKVIATIDIDALLPGAPAKFQQACEAIAEVRTLLNEIQTIGLSGEAQLQWARLQSLIAPLLNDVAGLFDGGKFNGKLVSHVVNLRNFSLDSVLDVIGAVRAQVAKDATAAPPGSKLQGDLNAVLARIDALVKLLSQIPAKIDEAVAPIRARLAAIDTWYDTVMQSFDERYTRGMRTWSIVIGFIVAIAFNASIFRIYDRLDSDDALRAVALVRTQSILTASQPVIAENETVLKSAQSPVDEKKAAERLKAIEKDVADKVSNAAATYSGLGFRPIWQDWSGITPADGLGWVIMALLLSLGAPFWHDALASLFGVKSLLEKKTQTRNVEQQSGEGATQTT